MATIKDDVLKHVRRYLHVVPLPIPHVKTKRLFNSLVDKFGVNQTDLPLDIVAHVIEEYKIHHLDQNVNIDTEALLSYMDENDDGSFDIEEFLLLFQYMSLIKILNSGCVQVSTLFTVFDTDDSESIDKDEFDILHQKMMSMDVQFLNLPDEWEVVSDEIDYDESGTITRDEWILGIFVDSKYKMFDIDPEHIALNREETSTLLRWSGFNEYSANEIFTRIDLDRNGYIEAAELRHHAEALRKVGITSRWFELIVFMVQLGFVGMIIWKIQVVDLHRTEVIADVFEILSLLGAMGIFLRWVFKDVWTSMAIKRTLRLIGGFATKAPTEDACCQSCV